jgi:hypothetical protein
MDTVQPIQATPPGQAKEILFPNGNRALSVTTAANTPAADVLNTLGIQQPKALLIVIGGASKLDDSLNARLKFLCNLGIARVAAEGEVAIIDGGTQAGIMELMGQAIAERGHQSILLGVAPSAQSLIQVDLSLALYHRGCLSIPITHTLS